MAAATVTSDSSNKSLQSLSFERSTTSRDASFSSYLNGSEENFILPDDRLHPKQKSKTEYEGEIDVFSADKYFNQTVGEMSPNIVNKDDPLDIASLKQKIRPRTPSVRSESSWNSRSSLLHRQKTDQQQKKMNRTKRFLASIGCRCSCNDEDSVHVDNQNSGVKEKGVTTKVDMNQFRRPNSNTWKEDRLTPDRVHDQISNPLHDQDECAKTSLEVFGSPIQTKGDKSSSKEMQVGKLAWVAAIKKVAETEAISADSNGKYNDTDSDASSDLFEIESFSTNTNVNPFLTRQESDGMSAGCVSPASCYAPSEVSVQWSTVTASMADFSMMSDSEELDIITTSTTNHSIKQTTNRRPGILSACQSYKAVKIAGEAYQTTEKAFVQDQKQQQRMETSKQTRFHTEYKLDTTRKDMQRRFTAHSSATESQFKCAPHPMYIH
ncbi:hypothetical protein LIER_09712 [Lithospermum erythrorhizon]|uniref:Protein PHYTOCHROME KINASE SUBSTRATE 1-like n=1 Tax=Lithospermum erythrorhizon TaxID=34254 RepID=A0AAV3PIM8_LITER